jgi:hypothetical protein
MKALIQRGTGDNIAAEALVDPLCVTGAVSAEKGKAFLYSEGFDISEYETEIPFRGALICSDIIEVLDASMGEQFYARLAGWQLNISKTNDAVKIRQGLQIERSLL